MLVATTPSESDDDWFSEITLAVHEGTVTFKSVTDVNEWFTYHASEEDFEESDQAALERFWTKLHAAIPELGAGIEIIETANPRSFYDQTRRKLGMVMGLSFGGVPLSAAGAAFDVSPGLQSLKIPPPQTVLPNLFMVGDTVSPGANVAIVAESALSLANLIKAKR
jgi:phytoene dehydrogenase-like protein